MSPNSCKLTEPSNIIFAERIEFDMCFTGLNVSNNPAIKLSEFPKSFLKSSESGFPVNILFSNPKNSVGTGNCSLSFTSPPPALITSFGVSEAIEIICSVSSASSPAPCANSPIPTPSAFEIAPTNPVATVETTPSPSSLNIILPNASREVPTAPNPPRIVF